MKREVLTTGKTVKNELTRLLLQTAGIHLKTDSNPAFWVTNMRELNPIIYFTLCIGLIMVAISAITNTKFCQRRTFVLYDIFTLRFEENTQTITNNHFFYILEYRGSEIMYAK